MNCYYHKNEVATASCQNCGKGLCSHCASFFNPPLCPDCANKKINAVKDQAVKKLIIMIVSAILGIIFCSVLDMSSQRVPLIGEIIIGAPLGLIVCGIPSGWRALNKITPNIFLFLPIIGWVIYFVVKGVLSAIIGIFALFITVIKSFLQIGKARKLSAYVSGMEKK